jgi:mannose-1-phosphate guanylyltransferase
MFALIMAGGSGTRLWPVSRKKNPKQLLKLIGNKTLLQNTFLRLKKGFSTKQIFVATTKQYEKFIAKQLPGVAKNHYSIEPEIKDRGPAIALAALLMHHHDPRSCFVTAWSDHFIKNELGYFKTLKMAESYLQKDPDTFITIGAIPASAHTGLGYIEKGALQKNSSGITIFKAKQFKEKPDLKRAQSFVKSGRFLWNTGYFICKTSRLLELYKQHQPKIYHLLMEIKPFIGTPKQQEKINYFYSQMPKVDIERGIIEKLKNVSVLEADFDWADIGSWKIIKDVLSEDHQNLTQGNVVLHNTNRSLVYNHEKKLVSVVGAEDLIVINTKDALLVANKHNSEQVKGLIEKLKLDKKLKKYL